MCVILRSLKPGISRILLSANWLTMIIYLVGPSPDRSCHHHGSMTRARCYFHICVAPNGVCIAPGVTVGTGELLPHRFTLTPARKRAERRLLSVALSGPFKPLVLQGILLCGVRTFLITAVRRNERGDAIISPTLSYFIRLLLLRRHIKNGRSSHR